MSYRRLATTIALLVATSVASQSAQRPPIYSISHVRIRVIEFEDGLSFYANTLGLPQEKQACDYTIGACFRVNADQLLQLHIADGQPPRDLVEEVAFRTSDVSLMSKYLAARGLHPGPIENHAGSAATIAVTDPDGHRIVFEQSAPAQFQRSEHTVSTHLIHAGFVVHDRAAEDHFYKDILGFRRYWHGGMKDDEDNWVSIQVPDGSDWLEYMLRIPDDADKRLLGIMNHVALGVSDIHAAQQQLLKNGWKPGEEPKIGRDGKWQLNVYDPDQTRVEFMEFTPVQKPCCSDFTGPHPKP